MSDRLPDDMQRLILDKVSSPRDHARFSCACKLWYSIYKERTFPWLVLKDHDNENHTHRLFSVYDQKIYQFSAPELEEKRICGSSHGWLVTIDNKLVYSLYNPFSRSSIHLPTSIKVLHAEESDGYIIDKVILSCNPHTNPNECIIMLKDFRGKLVYCKLGDKSWTAISPKIRGGDVIFHEGKILVVHGSQVYSCHIDSEPHLTPFGPKMSYGPHWSNLVNLEGDVVIVDRYYPSFTKSKDEEDDSDDQNDNDSDLNENEENTDEGLKKHDNRCGPYFDVYKLDEDMTSWRKENNIGDRTIFLGYNQSISLSTSLVPNSIANTIYYEYGGAGVFHLKRWKTVRVGRFKCAPAVWLIQN